MKQDLQAIIELMQDLQMKMAPGKEDLSERLGKPEVSVMKVEAGEPEMEEFEAEEGAEDELDAMVMGEETPEAKMKSRLMKLKG